MVEIFIPRAIYDASRRFIPPAATDKSIFFSLSPSRVRAAPFGKLKNFALLNPFLEGTFFSRPSAKILNTRRMQGVINLEYCMSARSSANESRPGAMHHCVSSP